jgi:geranylgeranyl reductase family protein
MGAPTLKTGGDTDVLVIGSGPAGCAAGIVLARRGIQVTVVDRAVFPRDKTCGDAISNHGVEILKSLGAWTRIERGPHAVVARAAAVFPDGTRVTREYASPGYIVPRYHLDDALRLALEESGARLLQGRSVTRLTRERERFTGAEGTGFAFRAKVVIAADGYGSVGVAALANGSGARPRGRTLAISATAYYRNADFPNGGDTADHHFDHELPYGYGWIFPAVGGVSNIGVYLRADGYERTGQKLKRLMDGFLERQASRLARAEPLGKVRVWSLPLAPNSMPVAAPGLLLVGDAAGLVDPLTGEGIWQGLRSGVLAGEASAEAVVAGGFDKARCRSYERALSREVSRTSRAKAWVQRAMVEVVDRKLYENAFVRSGIAWGYEHRALEMTKS